MATAIIELVDAFRAQRPFTISIPPAFLEICYSVLAVTKRAPVRTTLSMSVRSIRLLEANLADNKKVFAYAPH